MAIFTFGAVAYQNECGITASGFLDVLKLYFASTFEEWNDEVFIQQQVYFQRAEPFILRT